MSYLVILFSLNFVTILIFNPKKMNTQEVILREKIGEYYGSIFEKELIEEIVKVGFIENISKRKSLSILVKT